MARTLSNSRKELLTFFVTKNVQNVPVHAVILVSLDAGPEPSMRMLDTDQRISGLPRFTPDRKAVIYPIGENGVDDGGDPSLEKGVESSSFYWQNPRALDWVWPQPATEAEIQRYYEERARKSGN